MQLTRGMRFIDPNTRDLTPEVFDADGRFRIMDAEYWRKKSIEERGLLAVTHGMYVLPTTELVARLHELIGGRTAIEVGSGCGVLARSLGIPATDNRMQEEPEYRAIYKAMQQPVIAYGKNVERLTASEAVAQFRPQVVVAAWVTHKYNLLRPLAGGNEIGLDEESIIDAVETYVFVGNLQVHARKSIWSRPHEIEHPDYVYSRATNGTPDFIAVWNRIK